MRPSFIRVLPYRICGIVLGWLLAVTLAASAQGLMVTGYADFEATVSNVGGDGNSDFFFDNHHVNLILIGDIFGDLFAAVEVEYEHAGDEIALEYGYFAYTGIRNLRIMAGKFIVPFGRFNKDLHPTFINKMPDRPHGFSNILPQTYNDVGLWASGAVPMGQRGARFVFDGFVVNGLMGPDGGNIRGFRDNDQESRAGTRDDNKAVGGRVGFELGPQGFEVGFSAYHGNASDDETQKLDLTLLGADAAFRSSGFEVRGEIVTARQEASLAVDPDGKMRKTGGYAQVAYMAGTRFEPVVRISGRNMPGQDSDQIRFSVGLNYHISPASSARVAYHLNGEKTGFETDNNNVVLQWNVIF